jgi:hypothetical protein
VARAWAVLGLATGIGTSLLVGATHARQRPRCVPASYTPLLARLDGMPLENASSPGGALVIGSDAVTIGACGSTPATFKTGRHFTRFHVVWPACPGFGRVRLTGTLQAPPRSCKPLVAVMRWRDQSTDRRRALKFEALRIGPD